MDETDGWLIAGALTALAAVLLMVCQAIRELQQDVGLLRITAAVPDHERDS